MSKKERVVIHARDAENGQYVSIEYAKEHPGKTVIERDKIPAKKTKK